MAEIDTFVVPDANSEDEMAWLLEPPVLPPEPGVLHVAIKRTPFSDVAIIKLDDGATEELDYDNLRKWLVDRGADPIRVEDYVLGEVWNCPRVLDMYIRNPKLPPTTVSARNRVAPKI